MRCRLVQEDQGGILRESSGDHHPLSLPITQLREDTLSHIPQPAGIERATDDRLILRP